MDLKPIHKSIRRVQKFLKKVPQDPAPGKVHHLRTSTRRLEAAFQSVGLDAKSDGKRLLQDLRRIRKKAGKVRDIDVFSERALTLEAKQEEQDCLVELLEHLGMRRGKHAKKLHSAAGKVASRLRRELKRGWAELRPFFEANGKAGGSAKKMRAKAIAKEVQLADDLRLPLHLNRGNLHPYRLKVKELRYVLQLKDHRNQKRFVETLGEVKDAIGEWHDWQELTAIASDRLDHGPRCRLLQAMKSIGEAKYRRALKITNDMRKTYVNVPPVPRRAKPRVKRATLPAPITMAV